MKTLVFDTNPFIYKGLRMRKSTIAGVDHFLESFIICVQRTNPDKVICLIDPPGVSWRARVFPEYKLHRKRTTEQNLLREQVRKQLSQLSEILKCLPVAVCIQSGYEADDIAYWISRNVKGKHLLVTIDRDWLQLCSDKTSVYLFDKNVTVNLTSFVDLDVPQKPEGLEHGKYILYKAIVGDTSDGLPGLSGIGPVKARDYLRGKDFTNEQWSVIKRNFMLMDLSYCPYTPPVEDSIREQLDTIGVFNKKRLRETMRSSLIRHLPLLERWSINTEV